MFYLLKILIHAIVSYPETITGVTMSNQSAMRLFSALVLHADYRHNKLAQNELSANQKHKNKMHMDL